MSRSHPLRLLLVSLVVVCLAGVGWVVATAYRARVAASPARARRAGVPVPVRTALVSDAQIEAVVGGTAVTVPSARYRVRLAPSRRFNELNPVVRAVHVRNGQYVEAGQLLFEIDSDTFDRAVADRRQALRSARAALAQAGSAVAENARIRQVELDAAAAELSFRQADVAFRTEDYDRLTKLRADGNASLLEYLEAGAFYSKAWFELTRAKLRDQRAKSDMVLGPLRDQDALERAARDVKSAELALALAESDLGYCALHAGLAGLVDGVEVTAGQSVARGDELGLVLRIEPIGVRVDYPPEHLADLAAGQSVEVELDGFAGQTFAGTVVEIGAQVDETTRTLPVLVHIDNPDRRIRPGITGYARFRTKRRATTVPAVSVIDVNGSSMVFVVKDGRARVRPVTTGAVVDAGVVEVLGGLAAGEQVVVYGQQYLRDNERVNTDWRRVTLRDGRGGNIRR